MKAIRVIYGIILLSIFLMLSISASNTQQLVFEYGHPEATVIFDDTSFFSEQKKQEIADSLIGMQLVDDEHLSQENIICSLFGHNLSTSAVSVITHRVSIWNPRCRLDIYDVTGCSRCNYTEEVLVSSGRILCHPEELPLPESTNPTE